MLLVLRIERILLICQATFVVASWVILAVELAAMETIAMSGCTDTFPKPLTLTTLSSQHDVSSVLMRDVLIAVSKHRVTSKKLRLDMVRVIFDKFREQIQGMDKKKLRVKMGTKNQIKIGKNKKISRVIKRKDLQQEMDEDEFEDYVGTEEVGEEAKQQQGGEKLEAVVVENLSAGVEVDDSKVEKTMGDVGGEAVGKQQGGMIVREQLVSASQGQDVESQQSHCQQPEPQANQPYLQQDIKNSQQQQQTDRLGNDVQPLQPIEPNISKTQETVFQEHPNHEVQDKPHSQIQHLNDQPMTVQEQTNDAKSVQIEDRVPDCDQQPDPTPTPTNHSHQQPPQQDDEFGDFETQEQSAHETSPTQLQHEPPLEQSNQPTSSQNIPQPQPLLEQSNQPTSSQNIPQPQPLSPAESSPTQTTLQPQLPPSHSLSLQDELAAFINSLPSYKKFCQKSFYGTG